MPNRYIRESAIMSEPVNSLSWLGEVFYRRLMNKVDDFGRFTSHPALLRAAIFPLQTSKVRETDISRLLLECEKAGLLFVYAASDGKPLLILNKWEKGRASHSDYDEPPVNLCERMKTYVYSRKHKHTAAPDSDSDSDTDSNSDADKGAKAPVDDLAWLASLKTNPAYEGVDVPRELAKAKTWAETKKRKYSRPFIVNWLNRCEKSVAAPGGSKPPKPVSKECHGWKSILNHEFASSPYSDGGDLQASEWEHLSPEMQQAIWKHHKAS